MKFISVLEDLDGNHFRLYYSTEAMRIQTPQDAIVLEGDIKDFINRAKVKNGDWVSIVGRFTQMTGNEIKGYISGQFVMLCRLRRGINLSAPDQ